MGMKSRPQVSYRTLRVRCPDKDKNKNKGFEFYYSYEFYVDIRFCTEIG